MRSAELKRNTEETQIKVKLDLDGTGTYDIHTGCGFLDHMLAQLSRHGLIDLNIDATGDLNVDAHHLAEDAGIVIGTALSQALGDKKGINRYGSSLLPMDETLVMAALDFSGRPYLAWDVKAPVPYIKDLDTALFQEFFRGLCAAAGLNLHIKLLAGGEVHHIFEAVFKGFARAVRSAVESDPRESGIPSTKGVL